MNAVLNLFRSLEAHSGRACIEERGNTFTYRDLLEEARRWQSRLERTPVSRGAVIALRAEYSLSAVAALLAMVRGGVIPALMPRDRSATEYLAHCRAAALLEIPAEGAYSYHAVEQPFEQHPLLEQLRETGEPGLIVFTSGSTGAPKAALHSVERFLLKFECPGRALRTLAFLLFDHIAGLDTLFYTLCNGGTVIVAPRRDPQTILELISLQRVEVLPTSPSFLRLLCARKEAWSVDTSSIKMITYGSEPMDAATLLRVNECFRGVKIIQKYGTTETGAPRTVSRSNDSLWLKFKEDKAETKIVNGVLWLRSKGTMLGYLNAPSTVAEDGWYCTGDLVEVDGEWIRFLGREDEIVKVGGEKVSPCEVERVIRELDFVDDVFVLAEPHALMGHVVSARVGIAAARPVPMDAMSRIRLHCRQRLGPHHSPVRIDLVSGAALAPLGYRLKVQRRR